jgi:DNA polymerase III sliding clamp (beta) subunit (PCNA family)
MKITIPINQLLAIAEFVSTDDARPHLKGILLEVTKKDAHLVATDGWCMGILELDKSVLEPVRVTMPILPLRMFQAIDYKMLITIDTIEKKLGPCELMFSAGGLKIGCSGLPDEYPKWRQCLPAPEQCTHPGLRTFDAELLKKFINAAKWLNTTPKLDVTCEEPLAPMLVKLMNCREFTGVLMPVKK